ncbi:28S ribosomal protein S9, mitochondrial-like [Uloborus diversus]|uniref:28S ribosomal protein S9, mitochondrial-like n=1 Tax=Uloborus diversus TaxID=327109 RepID=UPI00240A38E6|nr:28S ribosomal protein S9, mitochondrial-like [Uloborus diversus]
MISKTVIVRNLHFDFVNRLLCVPSIYTITKCLKVDTSGNKLPESVQVLKPLPKSSASAVLKIKTISKAMKAYLERAKSHEDFLTVKNREFEIGRHHLANMMGLEVGTLTQDDIDRAISYLLPSGLYEKKARPVMKPPEKMFPKEKAAQFDYSGRPFSPFFYTRKSNYYETLHNIVRKFHELDDFEDKMIEKGILEPPKEALISLSGGEWLTIDEIRNIFLEKITEQDYDFFIATLTRLGSHPYSFRCKDLIWKYRKDFENVTALEAIPELMHDENGRPYMEMMGYKKNCEAKVIVRGNGTGKIMINGQDISYFPKLQDREQIMYPLAFTDLLLQVDVEADVSGPGESSQSGAIRLGIAMCLRSFVSPELVEKMRLAGLLTRDFRFRGRKKPGQKGIRAKFTWKKR